MLYTYSMFLRLDWHQILSKWSPNIYLLEKLELPRVDRALSIISKSFSFEKEFSKWDISVREAIQNLSQERRRRRRHFIRMERE